MMDRLRELLFPLTVLAIVGSVYAMAMARSGEAEVERHLRPSSDRPMVAAQPVEAPAATLHAEQASLLD
ncbi:MAG TPA: hypothetical protein VGN72_21080 [Tepidisphaeraceae bacterium]|jgi:hypothetical protein|nr:hypothetical protein [Tepidisphaeraceae bacterium]